MSRNRVGVKSDIRRLLRVVEFIRQEHPRMELGQLSVLLRVISDPGLRADDMKADVGVSSAAMSRNVRALSEVSYLKDTQGNEKGGLNLIAQMVDPSDGRARVLMPTASGSKFTERLSDLMRR